MKKEAKKPLKEAAETIKEFVRICIYGPILIYHSHARQRFNMEEHPTVMLYHYEMALYYLDKIFGEVPENLKLSKARDRQR